MRKMSSLMVAAMVGGWPLRRCPPSSAMLSRRARTALAPTSRTRRFEAYVARAKANQLIDQQVRQVDIGRRTSRGRGAPDKIDNPNATVAEHDLVSEVYHVIERAATLVLGPISSERSVVPRRRRPCGCSTARQQREVDPQRRPRTS
jgi:hypothetical protein